MIRKNERLLLLARPERGEVTGDTSTLEND
jgi:hypothetical protein